MKYKEISFEGFKGREELLEKIKRYSMYQIMFFRTNVSVHSKRMQKIAEEIIPYIVKVDSFDQNKLRILCRIHDDPEIITGDHQLGRKIHTMTEKELQNLKESEERARQILSIIWPKKIHEYDYYQLLIESEEKNTFEAQLMKLIDRLDGFGESLHEIYSGNSCFLHHPALPKGINPVQTYAEILKNAKKSYPLLAKVLEIQHPFLLNPLDIDQEEIVKRAKLPTKDSVNIKTGNPHYDKWREITLAEDKEQGLSLLIEKKE